MRLLNKDERVALALRDPLVIEAMTGNPATAGYVRRGQLAVTLPPLSWRARLLRWMWLV